MTTKIRKKWIQGDLFFDPLSFKKEPGGGKRITEQAGYIPIQVQVRNMLVAGERLNEYRKEQFDFGPGEEVPSDVSPDITRSPYFDLADATQIGRAAEERLADQAKEIEKEKRKKLEIPEEPKKIDPEVK